VREESGSIVLEPFRVSRADEGRARLAELRITTSSATGSDMFAVPEGPDTTPGSVAVQCRDPADQMFPDLARAACADALVTGDADLLTLAATFPAPIIAPAEARRRLSPEAHG